MTDTKQSKARGRFFKSWRALAFGAVQLVALAVACVMVVVGLGGDRPANAFVNANFNPTVPSYVRPSVNATLKAQQNGKDVSGDDRVEFDSTFNYNGTLTFNNWPGDVVTSVSVSQDPLSPFTSAPSSADFTWSNLGGAPAPKLGSPTMKGNSWTFTISDPIPSGAVLTFNKEAQMGSQKNVGNASVTTASLGASTTGSIEPPTWAAPQLTGVKVSDTRGLTCYGVARYETGPLSKGAWLADMKFAQQDTMQFVNFNGLPVASSSAPTVGSGYDSIWISAPGQDAKSLTQDILKNATYNPNDPSKPLYPNALVAANPNAKFVDSYNWQYDPQTFTGNTWLPKGANVVIQRLVQMNNCVNGFSLTPERNRTPVLAAIEVGRPVLFAGNTAYAMVQAPGAPDTQLSCQAVSYIATAEASDTAPSNRLGIVDTMSNPWTTKTVQNALPFSSGAMAQSQLAPERAYFWTARGKVVYYDSNNGKTYLVNVKNNDMLMDVPNIPSASNAYGAWFPWSLGFDKSGRLWTWKQNTNKTPTQGQFYYIDGITKSGTPGAPTEYEWKPGPVVQDLTGIAALSIAPRVYDFAFDKDGNVYALEAYKTSVPSRYVFDVLTIPSVVSADGKTVNTGTIDLYKVGNRQNVDPKPKFLDGYDLGLANPLGLAYDSQGRLIIAFGDLPGLGASATRAFGVLDPATGRVDVHQGQPEGGKSSNSLGYIFDLASCNFGDKVTPLPQFRVQKSVVDPKTGAIVPAGTSSPNPVQMRQQLVKQSDGTYKTLYTATVDYYVTVTNYGNAAGNPGTIADTLTLGSDRFSADALRIDGQPASGVTGFGTNTLKFNLQPGQLDAGDARIFKLSVDVSVEDGSGSLWGTKIGECRTEGAGTPGYGMFNRVQMKDDGDGPNNNDACVPVEIPQSAQLFLYKRIHRADGTIVGIAPGNMNRPVQLAGSNPDDPQLKAFTLVANGPTPFKGEMNLRDRQLPWKGVGGNVEAGKYHLGEYSNAPALTENFNYGTSYECFDYSNGASVPVDQADTVEVKPGKQVFCYIANYETVPFQTRKLATDPVTDYPAGSEGAFGTSGFTSADASHIGKTVQANADGSVVLNYTVQVINSGSVTGNTGKVTDFFAIPAGLEWDGNKSATVTFSGKGVRNGGQSSYSQAQFTSLDGVVLANSVQRLAPKAIAEFKISVPLKTAADFDKYADNLKACVKDQVKDQTGTHNFTNSQKGVGNLVGLENEQRYGDDYLRDNLACIPVEKPDQVKIVVRKTDGNGTLGLGGAAFSICPTEPQFDGNGKLLNTNCQEMPAVDKVAGLDFTQRQYQRADYWARWGGAAVCNKYLPEGVQQPAWQNIDNYGPAFKACINRYTGATPLSTSAFPAGMPADKSLFVSGLLVPGEEYWLVETKAPLCDQQQQAGNERYCYSLLPQPLKFKVDADKGISAYGKINGANSASWSVANNGCSPFEDAVNGDTQCQPQASVDKVGNTAAFKIYGWQINVQDPRQPTLPKAGGTGPGWMIGLGALIILSSGGYVYHISRRSRKAVKA